MSVTTTPQVVTHDDPAHLDTDLAAGPGPGEEPRRGLPSPRRIAVGIGRALSGLWLLALLMGVWEVVARRRESLFFPPVSEIVATVRDEFLSGPATRAFLSETFMDNVVPSLSRAGRGWAIAVVVGISVGVLLGVWRNGAALFSPLVRFGMSIPATVLLPLAVVLFGVTSSMNVFLIAFGSVWVVLVNTMDGVRHIDDTAMTTARSLRLSRTRTFTSVLLPGASPQIFSGLRVSIGITLILMVVSELFAATSGIGYYIVYAQRTFRYEQVWAGVFVLGAIGILVNLAYAVIERWLLRWHIQARRQHD